MADFISTLELRPRLEAAGVYADGENFEALYSRLVATGSYAALVKDLEDEVFNYFTELRLPSHPTIYDHLILSLRANDIVASFNWDPFLVQAIQRCGPLAEPPLCLHLHGNVATGYCTRHEKASIGNRGNKCRQCGEPLVDSRLLYPVAQKDYAADPLISLSWQSVQSALKDCFLLTIFGYGAPATDVEAVSLMKQGWGDVNIRSLEETEIIDVRSEEDLCETWSPFIHSHHYGTHTSFYESMLALLPRRSVEMMTRQLLDAEHIEYFPLPKEANWGELCEWIRPFRDQEQSLAE